MRTPSTPRIPLFDEVRTWSAHSGFRLSDFPDLEGLFPHLEKAAVSPSSAPLDTDALWALRETLLQGRKAAQSINENGAMWPSLRISWPPCPCLR